MKQTSSLFRQPVPTQPRMPLHLPCMIHAANCDYAGTVSNISYCGVRVEVGPAACSHCGPLKGFRSLTIEGIGRLEVWLRWRKHNAVGLAFRSERQVRPALVAYFNRIGKHPH